MARLPSLRRLVPSSTRGRIGAATGAAVALTVVAYGLAASPAGPGSAQAPRRSATTTATTRSDRPPTGLEVVIDGSIVPSVATVPGLVDGEPPRPVGRLQTVDGRTTDIVLGEAVLVAPDAEAVEALETQDGVEVLDVDAPEEAVDDDGVEVLLRLDDGELDLDKLARSLAAVEPGLAGRLSVSDEATALTLARLADLHDEGMEVAPNDVPQPDGVPDGRVIEGTTDLPNAFDWPFVRSGATQDIGLDTAWQMLDHHGKHSERVTVLVVDKGFVEHADLPAGRKIRKGSWGPADDWTNSSGALVPYHGTDAATTAVARIDNGFGTAGPAGPYAFLVAMPINGGSYETLRDLRQVVREEEPDVINLSYGSEVTVFTGAITRRYDRSFRIAQRHGALAFASAGNEGLDVDDLGGRYLPCASTHVVCVGGMAVDSAAKDPGSNHGSDADDRSVELYGPFCTYGFAEHETGNPATRRICGTSFASPFVAGVAALLRVADPSLTPQEMQQILFETAHVGDLGPGVGGNQRRINAHRAVERALDVTWGKPTVSITEGGGTHPLDEVISLAGTAHSYTGEPVPIRWHSSLDGWLTSTPKAGPVGASLSVGEHVIQAIAVDRRRVSGVATTTVRITNLPPVVSIVSPSPGMVILEGTPIDLIGYSHDPDPYVNTSLDDGQVQWTVRNATSGDVVAERDRHNVTIAGLPPGEYTVRFTGTDAQGASAEATASLEVLALAPGQVPPVAKILRPQPGTVHNVSGGPEPIELRGIATGTDGNAISGQRFRWTAHSDNGHTVTLCTGSGFPGAGGGGLTTAKSCANVTVPLGLAPGAVGRTVWSIKLEAFDNAGQPVQANRAVEVVYHVA